MLAFWQTLFEKDGVLDRFGFPIIVVIGLSIAIYGSVSWTAKNIAKPVADKHIQFLETEQASMKTIAEQTVRQTDQMAKQHDLMEQNTKILRDIRDDQRKFPAVSERRD